MLHKILRFIASLALILLPFAPLPEAYPGPVDHTNIVTYLLVGSLLALVMVLLALFIITGSKTGSSTLGITAWLLFALGPIVLFPLHLGPPIQSPALLQSMSTERLRYGMLLLAVIIFCSACWRGLVSLQLHRTVKGRIFLIIIVALAWANLWDNYDSWSFGRKMEDWVAAGNRAEDFFPSYNFHPVLRTTARILLYAGAGGLCFLLSAVNRIKKWQTLSVLLFCLAGVAFCTLSALKGPQYYFPFMVPAIALAPAYWIGLALLRGTKDAVPLI